MLIYKFTKDSGNEIKLRKCGQRKPYDNSTNTSDTGWKFTIIARYGNRLFPNIFRDQQLITGRRGGRLQNERGQVKSYPYKKKGGGAKKF